MMKYFTLLLINAVSICIVGIGSTSILASDGRFASGAKLNNTALVNCVPGFAEVVPDGQYSGIDPNFVKGQKVAIGFLVCPIIKNKADGNIVMLSYSIDKKRGELVPVAGNLTFGDYSKKKGVIRIKVLSSKTEIRGNNIVFSFGAVDAISWKGKPWEAPTHVYGTYDTSNGQYSIQIYQYTPDDIK